MKKYWSILSLVVLTAFASSCDDTSSSPNVPAKRLTVEQIQKNPGYAWFDTERSSYVPNTAVVEQIKANFKADEHNIYIHVNPSCGCEGTQKLFPQFMRVVEDAAIPEANTFIYSMARTSDEHPETSQFTVTQLPSIFVTKKGTLVATIKDVIPGTSVEEQILAALSK